MPISGESGPDRAENEESSLDENGLANPDHASVGQSASESEVDAGNPNPPSNGHLIVSGIFAGFFSEQADSPEDCGGQNEPENDGGRMEPEESAQEQEAGNPEPRRDSGDDATAIELADRDEIKQVE